MKAFSAALVAILFLSAAFAFADVPLFEGVLTVHGQGAGMTNSATVYLSGKKAKILPKEQIGGTNGYPLVDFETMKLTLLVTSDKYYMEMPLAAMDQQIAAKAPGVKDSGKKDKLLGRVVEEWIVKDGATGLDVHLWATTEISTGVNLLVGFSRAGDEGLLIAAAAREILGKGMMPLKITAQKGGKDYFFWQIDSIEPGTVEASTFDIPAGYVRFSDFMKKSTKTAHGR
jgi:hypothetical protein